MKVCAFCVNAPAIHRSPFCGTVCANNAAAIASRAHQRVFRAVLSGLLPRLDGSIKCADCGGAANEYDHRDYTRPLDVEPVCGSCNSKRGVALVYRATLALEEAA